MSSAAERLVSRQLSITHRRPNPAREPLFSPGGRLLSWKPPTAARERPLTHYRIRFNDDSGAPDYELSAGQTAMPIPEDVAVVYLSAYNAVLDAESERLHVTLSSVSPAIPAVALFLAGQSNGDGTFAPNMYWDILRTRMLVDWVAVAPANRENWSAVQVWVKTPAGGGAFNYTPATAPIPLEDFGTSGNDRFYHDTISMEASSVPDPPENWVFIAASLDADGILAVDGSGKPTGKTVTLATLAKNDDVTAFDATLAYEKSEGGQEMFRVTSTWVNPSVPRFKGVKIVMTGLGGGDVLLDTVQEGFTASKSNAIAVPDVATEITIYAQTIYGDNTVKPITASTPKKVLTVQKQLGSVGQEYAPLVAGFTVATSWGTNGQGQKVFFIDSSWTKPSSALFGGVRIKMIRGGTHYELSGIEPGATHRYELSHFPATTENVTVYALSVDTNNRTNSYALGVTPSQAVQLTAPDLGGAGVEYTAVVIGFSAAVDYPANADGTYRARVQATFTPPADATWGGLDLVTYDGVTYTTRARVRSSPAIFQMPVPTTSQTWTVYGVSFDVNGRRNNIQVGVTPSSNIIVGTAAGTLLLSKADANSFDSLDFVIASNKFKILQIDGSLIVSGTVSSSKLNATEISVGGGPNKPGKFGVYNASGVQIGFIGVEAGNEGAWFKTLSIGGTAYASGKLKADASGNVALDGATLTLNLNGVTTTIQNAAFGGEYAGIKVANNTSPNAAAGIIYTGFISQNASGYQTVNIGTYVVGGSGLAWIYNSTGTPTIKLDGSGPALLWNGTTRLDSSGNADFAATVKIAGIQVLATRQAAVADITITTPSTGSVTADSFTGDAYNIVEDLKQKLNALLARVRIHGLIAP